MMRRMFRQMIYRRAAVVFLLIALMALCALAQTPAVAKTDPADVPATDAITGKVLDERGQPLFGAAVYARVVGSSGRQLTAITERDGSFKFNGLERAAYALTASLPAYTTLTPDPSVQ